MEATLQLTQTELDVVAGLALFRGISDGEMVALAAQLKRRRYQRGEVIYRTEDMPGSLYVLLRGQIKLRLQSPSGKHLTMSWVRPPSFFGTISLLDGQDRVADAIAVEPCELLVLHRDNFRSFLREHPHEMEVLLEITAARWRNTMIRLADMAFLDVPGRLAKTLVDFARMGDPGGNARVELTQSELAGVVGTTRETVGRLLKTFEDAKMIAVRRGAVVVLDAPALQRQVRY